MELLTSLEALTAGQPPLSTTEMASDTADIVSLKEQVIVPAKRLFIATIDV